MALRAVHSFYCHMLFNFHEYTKISLSILVLIENLSGFQFWDITNNADINISVHVFSTQHCHLRSLYKEAKLFGHRITFPTLEGNTVF